MSSNPFRDTIRNPEMANLCSLADEFAGFKELCPLLFLGFFGEGQTPASFGELEVGLKNYGGSLQATLRVPSADEFAFVELDPSGSILEQLETRLRDGSLRWQKARPKEKKRA